MNILIDIVHPATVHLFRNFRKVMESKGHNITITARNKSITFDLLNKYDIDYIVLGRHYKSMFGKLIGIFLFSFKLAQIIKKQHVNIMMDSCFAVYTGIASKITNIPLININNTDVSLFLKYSHFLISAYLTPVSFNMDFGPKHIKCDMFNELAFLHPNHYKPNHNVLKKIGLKESDNFVLLRFVSWEAAEEIKSNMKSYGYSLKEIRDIVSEFSKYSKILISCDYELPKDLEEYHIEKNDKVKLGEMQDLEYYATLFFGESGAMASECAMLGTPALFISSKRLGFIEELEKKYNLVLGFTSKEKALKKAVELLKNQSTKKKWQIRREKMLSDKIDFTSFLIWFIENWPESFKIMKNNPDYQNKFK